MLKFNASAFYKVSIGLQIIKTKVGSTQDAEITKEIAENVRNGLVNVLKELQSSLKILDAKISAFITHELLTQVAKGPITFKQFALSVDHIDTTLMHELSNISLFVMPSKKVEYFNPPSPIFGRDVEAAFPSAAYEIEEASKCFALDRDTGAVFHLMRTMEIAIRAIAKCIGVSDPITGFDKNWGSILRKMKAEIEKRNSASPQLWNASADREFFENAYASLDAVRVAWRNTTMHVENKYTADEAEHIFSAVKGFLMKLASRCDENGDPKA